MIVQHPAAGPHLQLLEAPCYSPPAMNGAIVAFLLGLSQARVSPNRVLPWSAVCCLVGTLHATRDRGAAPDEQMVLAALPPSAGRLRLWIPLQTAAAALAASLEREALSV